MRCKYSCNWRWAFRVGTGGARNTKCPLLFHTSNTRSTASYYSIRKLQSSFFIKTSTIISVLTTQARQSFCLFAMEREVLTADGFFLKFVPNTLKKVSALGLGLRRGLPSHPADKGGPGEASWAPQWGILLVPKNDADGTQISYTWNILNSQFLFRWRPTNKSTAVRHCSTLLRWITLH